MIQSSPAGPTGGPQVGWRPTGWLRACSAQFGSGDVFGQQLFGVAPELQELSAA